MDIKTAADSMRKFLQHSYTIYERGSESCDKDHLYHMIRQIEEGKVTGEKAHRWLGYIQGVLVYSGSATLEQVKQANKAA